MVYCQDHPNYDPNFMPDIYDPFCWDCWEDYFHTVGNRAVTGLEMETLLEHLRNREGATNDD